MSRKQKPFGMQVVDRELASYERWISDSRLKMEIPVAVWNWEERRGLPHYDGRTFGKSPFFFGDGRNINQKASHNGHKGYKGLRLGRAYGSERAQGR